MTRLSKAPRDFQGLKALISQSAGGLPRRLVQVATFALENPDEIAFGTAASIAKAADVQPSTLVRFSQTLGYRGFSELQEVFQSRIRERVLNYDERIAQLREHARSASKPNVILHGLCEASQHSLAALVERTDPATLDRAVGMLAKAGTIYLIGLRRSFPVAAYMAYSLSKLGVRHVLVDGARGLAPEELSFASAEDAVLAVSFTPYASETIALAQAAADRKVPVVAITDSPFSPLVPVADCWFEVIEAQFEGFRSTAATFALAMTLTVAVAEKKLARG
jgi:DNA-binding MurR/RpiR family transcriptional regulator